jgi:arsenite methyltransferase
MDENNIKNAVQTYYADIAKNRTSCCQQINTCCSSDQYQMAEDSFISEADLGLSCGLPTQTAGLKPGETVLDLGSGAGVDVFRAAQAVGPKGFVIGVDMTPEMIARSRANAEKGGFTNVEFRLGEIENLPVDDESVDLVISNCVINLVPEKGLVFDEIFRVLKPGGRISISDIVTHGDIPEYVRQDMSLWAGCIAGAMDRDVYLKLVEESGFSNIQVRNYIDHDAYKGHGYGIASMTFEAEKA